MIPVSAPSRPRSFWRAYYADAVARAEAMLERPLTLAERKIVVRAVRHHQESGTVSSASVLGVFVSMSIREPNGAIWYPWEWRK